MIKIKIKNKFLNEARSKQRWRHTLSNNFASYVSRFLRENPKEINKSGLIFSPSDFAGDVEQDLIKDLSSVGVFFLKKQEVKKPYVLEAAYYYGDSSVKIGDQNFNFSRGDIKIVFIIDSKIKNFKQLKEHYQTIYFELQNYFYHELDHYVADFSIGLEADAESPFHFIPKVAKERFEYLAGKDEVSAFVGQIMEMVKQKRTDFLTELELFVEEDSSFNAEFQKIKNLVKADKINLLLKIIKFKYLDYAIKKYNSVREDGKSLKMFYKLLKELNEKDIYL
jgi:hypothetical protein